VWGGIALGAALAGYVRAAYCMKLRDTHQSATVELSVENVRVPDPVRMAGSRVTKTWAPPERFREGLAHSCGFSTGLQKEQYCSGRIWARVGHMIFLGDRGARPLHPTESRHIKASADGTVAETHNQRRGEMGT
jgi:hypothetical protein